AGQFEEEDVGDQLEEREEALRDARGDEDRLERAQQPARRLRAPPARRWCRGVGGGRGRGRVWGRGPGPGRFRRGRCGWLGGFRLRLRAVRAEGPAVVPVGLRVGLRAGEAELLLEA